MFANEGGDRVDNAVTRGCFVLGLEFQPGGHVHAAAHDHGAVGGQTERTHRIGQGVGFARIEDTVAVLVDEDDGTRHVAVQAGVGDGQCEFLGGHDRTDVARYVRDGRGERVSEVRTQVADDAGRNGDRPAAVVDRAGVAVAASRAGHGDGDRLSEFGSGGAGQHQTLLGFCGAEDAIARWRGHVQRGQRFIQRELEGGDLRGVARDIGLLNLQVVSAILVQCEAAARCHLGPGGAVVGRVLPGGSYFKVVEEHRAVVGDFVRAAVAGVTGQGQLGGGDAGVECERKCGLTAQVATGIGLTHRYGFEAIARHCEAVAGAGVPCACPDLVLPCGSRLGVDGDLAVGGGDTAAVLNSGVPDAGTQVRDHCVHSQGEGGAGGAVAGQIGGPDDDTEGALPQCAGDLRALQVERPGGTHHRGVEFINRTALGEDELDRTYAGLGDTGQANAVNGFDQVDDVVGSDRAAERGHAGRSCVVGEIECRGRGRNVARLVGGFRDDIDSTLTQSVELLAGDRDAPCACTRSQLRGEGQAGGAWAGQGQRDHRPCFGVTGQQEGLCADGTGFGVVEVGVRQTVRCRDRRGRWHTHVHRERGGVAGGGVAGCIGAGDGQDVGVCLEGLQEISGGPEGPGGAIAGQLGLEGGVARSALEIHRHIVDLERQGLGQVCRCIAGDGDAPVSLGLVDEGVTRYRREHRGLGRRDGGDRQTGLGQCGAVAHGIGDLDRNGNTGALQTGQLRLGQGQRPAGAGLNRLEAGLVHSDQHAVAAALGRARQRQVAAGRHLAGQDFAVRDVRNGVDGRDRRIHVDRHHPRAGDGGVACGIGGSELGAQSSSQCVAQRRLKLNFGQREAPGVVGDRDGCRCANRSEARCANVGRDALDVGLDGARVGDQAAISFRQVDDVVRGDLVGRQREGGRLGVDGQTMGRGGGRVASLVGDRDHHVARCPIADAGNGGLIQVQGPSGATGGGGKVFAANVDHHLATGFGSARQRHACSGLGDVDDVVDSDRRGQGRRHGRGLVDADRQEARGNVGVLDGVAHHHRQGLGAFAWKIV